MFDSRCVAFSIALALLGASVSAQAQVRRQPAERTRPAPSAEENDLVQLDFNDVELAVVIDTIARLTGKNFIYDDRVRGRVTIVSPTKISVDQAYAVFESVLQVKGFTTVQGPGGAIKVIPIREAKESSIETIRGRTPASDRFITRLIPLRYIDSEAITQTLTPLVSKDASMVAYKPTNTVILTDSGSNIRRILDILSSIDVETYKEELAVIKLKHADGVTLAAQLSEIFDAETSAAGATAVPRRGRRTPQPQPTVVEPAARGAVRILTDERTNSLIVMASRTRLEEIRRMVRRLDVPVLGGGRIHVYYLDHADAEELSQTLSSLISGQPAPSVGGRGAAAAGVQAQALRAAITELAEGVTVTADVATNSLLIQASQEGYATLAQVIAKLDVPRPQVLVEALIMEVLVDDSQALGFNGLVRLFKGKNDFTIQSGTDGGDSGTSALLNSGLAAGGTGGLAGGFLANILTGSGSPVDVDGDGNPDLFETTIQSVIRASASDGRTNVLSAPHILTSDNEEAEIRIGDNIPIITSRVQTPGGTTTTADNLSTSVNVERQDIGVTLRVTPQITEGETLRLEIFQEITDVNTTLQASVGDAGNVGVALSSRRVENTVVVADGETVVIGGLLKDRYQDNVSKVPWLGDIPLLGWLFRTESRQLTKTNLLIFLTPRIVRNPRDLELQSIRKREEFRRHSEEALELSEREREAEEKRRKEAESAGIDYEPVEGRNPARSAIQGLEKRYPLLRMLEIERERETQREQAEAAAEAALHAPRYAVVAAVFRDQREAERTLIEVLDAGFDARLLSSGQADGVFFEVRVGPYDEMALAEEAAETMRHSFGLSPSVVVEREEP